MAVTIDAIFNSAGNSYISGTAQVDISGMTVGSSANALLVGVIIKDGSTDYSASLSVTWDDKATNQTMTLLGAYHDASIGANVLFYGLINPTPGAKPLGVTGTAGKTYVISAISLKGVNAILTSAAFTNFAAANSTTASLTPSVTVTSAVGRMVASFIFSGTSVVYQSISPTVWFGGSSLIGSAASYTAGAASVTLSATHSASSLAPWIAIGIDIAASPPAVLTAVNFAGHAPTLDVPTLNITGRTFTAVNYVDGAPTLSAAVFNVGRVFIANSFQIAAPTIPVLAAGLPSAPALTAPALTAGHPALGSPLFTVPPPLFATNFVTSSPTIPVLVIGFPSVPALTAPALMAGHPALGFPFIVVTSALTVVNFTTVGPQLGRPIIVSLRTADILAVTASSGHPILDAPACGELGPPLVWLRQRLKNWSNDPNAEYYDEDGTENEGPVQEAIFANLNDEIELSVSAGTLVGRSASYWGPAETIYPIYPLVLQNRALSIDLSNLIVGVSNYPNDAAAAAGGVLVGGLYRNGNVLMVRVT